MLSRHMRSRVLAALAESRAVAALGARQVGKSTLVADLAASDHPAEVLTLDVRETREAAEQDPTGFVAALPDRVAIDEVQRVPDLLLAIKQRLDHNQERGQFLLTGSANILSIPKVRDALPGRVDYLRLWPLSQGELTGRRETFIDRLLAGEPPRMTGQRIGRASYAAAIVAGGYPEAHERSRRGRSSFFASYTDSLLGRDLADIATVRNVDNVKRLLRLIASRTAGLASFHGMARDLGVDTNTARSHTGVLEDLFLVRSLPAWHSNLGSRQIKSPKLHIVDSGLLAWLAGVDEQRLADDGPLAGACIESFVAMELLRQSEWAEAETTLHHYRDQQGREVDVVIETPAGDVVGVEVKAGASARPADFRGLAHMRDRLGS